MDTDTLIPKIKENGSIKLLHQIQNDFIGLDTKYQIVDGEEKRRIYLDSTASTHMIGIAHRTGE